MHMIDYTAATPETYFYILDVHGNVVALADETGNKVVNYEYDAWGLLTNTPEAVTTGNGEYLRNANPFRYRSYQFDPESGLYYLKARYYTATLGRFLTRDANTQVNLYMYCDNDPINREDPDGEVWSIAAGALIGAGFSIATQMIEGKKLSDINWRNVGAAALSGAIAGIPFGGVAGAAVFGAAGNVVSNRIQGSSKSWRDDLNSAAIGAGASLVGSAAGKIVRKVAVKKFSKLPRSSKKIRLQKLYKTKGISRNKNLRKYKSDVNFVEKLAGRTRLLIYSGVTSEVSNYISGKARLK